jgi:hypothetical protein
MNKLIHQFEEYCLEYEQACILNDHKIVNKKHSLVQKTFLKIKKSNMLSELLPLLNNANETVRLWVSSRLLPYYEKESRRVLEDIMRNSAVNNSSAKIILDTYDGKELTFP